MFGCSLLLTIFPNTHTHTHTHVVYNTYVVTIICMTTTATIMTIIRLGICVGIYNSRGTFKFKKKKKLRA